MPGDTNNDRDVFVRDLETGTTTRASVFAGDRQIPGISDGGTISDDGQYVAFVVSAFTGRDDEGNWLYGQQAYVRDLLNDTTRLATPADDDFGNTVYEAEISGSGDHIAFTASGDYAGDGSGLGSGIDLTSGTTTRQPRRPPVHRDRPRPRPGRRHPAHLPALPTGLLTGRIQPAVRSSPRAGPGPGP
ncbi:hypothetical protein GCM10010435_62060 [Winogradskya consettensis]|uniref:Uncharacterized protein n=1 Tax=Winogradskya consettensis TaxID=113560 RepID=A0A919SR68_9ACTN|nr:hypothetical protein [Actinoplanes consettensis]GIM76069.1 hypothetical protein Aco04nite_48490 [Actinoplanes consettensis]